MKRDERVAVLALADGRKRGLPIQENGKEVAQILWQSPYVQWLQQVQGVKKTQNYVNLTVQAAYQMEKQLEPKSSCRQYQRLNSDNLIL